MPLPAWNQLEVELHTADIGECQQRAAKQKSLYILGCICSLTALVAQTFIFETLTGHACRAVALPRNQ